MANAWNYNRAAEHIDSKIEEVRSINIKEYKRDMSLENIPTNTAYRVDGVHLYADITNLEDILNVTQTEGETCHKRALRFLNLHYRAVDRILNQTETKRVDFHNQRLHALITKPYNTEDDAEATRVRKAVAIAQIIIDVLAETGEEDEHIPTAKVRVGIDTGKALAVNNGRSGNREPLFLGEPANHAAKLASNAKPSGIYLTNDARSVIGLPSAEKPAQSPLTVAQVDECIEKANLDISKDDIVKDWKADLIKNPIGTFEFTRHTPPFCNIDIQKLTPGNSRRQEAVSIYADIDGFTNYVGQHIEDSPEDVVRVLHVVRAELERVLSKEFQGRRVRFIGDCVHGLICEGTAPTTDEKETISAATLLAGAFRSSFDLALERLKAEDYETGELGLAIGFEYGPMTITRLGLKSDRVRCSVSRGVLESERQQKRCTGVETAIGESALKVASDAVKTLFGSQRKVKNLDFNEAAEALSDAGDARASAVRQETYAKTPAILAATQREIRPYCKK